MILCHHLLQRSPCEIRLSKTLSIFPSSTLLHCSADLTELSTLRIFFLLTSSKFSLSSVPSSSTTSFHLSLLPFLLFLSANSSYHSSSLSFNFSVFFTLRRLLPHLIVPFLQFFLFSFPSPYSSIPPPSPLFTCIYMYAPKWPLSYNPLLFFFSSLFLSPFSFFHCIFFPFILLFLFPTSSFTPPSSTFFSYSSSFAHSSFSSSANDSTILLLLESPTQLGVFECVYM